jgi:hypothetical protein
MQPYYLPYIGYFSLIKHTDTFIVFDTVQFIRHGWIERNRILKPEEGWQYIQVPLLKYHQSTIIKDILINNSIDWRRKIIAQIQHYKKKAPYYFAAIKLLNDIFSEDFEDIVTLNQFTMLKICSYLGINKKIEVFSKMNIHIPDAKSPDEWALNICKAIDGVTEYWNLTGGISFFDRSKYEANNISLKFQKIALTEYNQNRSSFEGGLSIIDVIMFNSPEQINQMLDNYELL